MLAVVCVCVDVCVYSNNKPRLRESQSVFDTTQHTLTHCMHEMKSRHTDD